MFINMRSIVIMKNPVIVWSLTVDAFIMIEALFIAAPNICERNLINNDMPTGMCVTCPTKLNVFQLHLL